MQRYRSILIMLMVVLIVFILLLIASFNANLQISKRSNEYYRDLNATRLDPYGLAAFPTSALPIMQADPRPLVVFFGDSRAADWPVPTLPAYRFLNRGIGSQTAVQVAGRYRAHITPLHPNILIVQVGINDLKVIAMLPAQRDTIVTNCQHSIASIVTAAQAEQTTVILMTIIPAGTIPLERQWLWSSEVDQAVNEVNAYIRSLAAPRVIIFDAAALLTDATGRVAPEYQQDELHFNAMGYTVLNAELIALLARLP